MRYLEFGRDISRNTIDHTPGAEGLTVADYIIYVTPDMYAPHATTLSSIEFYGATLFENLRQVLISCRRMRELTMTHISLDQYQRFSDSASSASVTNFNFKLNSDSFSLDSDSLSSSNFIEARDLLTIEFNNDRSITKDELIILDFFHTQVKFPVLRSLLFNTMTYGFQPKHWANQVMELYGQQLPSAILPHFLVKCSTTLKTFSIRRHEFTFYNENKSNSKLNPMAMMTFNQNGCETGSNYSPVTKKPRIETANDSDSDFADFDSDTLSLVQLTKIRFQCDTEGIHHLLNMQNHVEKLDCYSHHEETNLNLAYFPQLKRSIEQCIENCAATLKQVHTIGIIAFPKCQIDEFLNPSANVNVATDSEGNSHHKDQDEGDGDCYGQGHLNHNAIITNQNFKMNPAVDVDNDIFITDLKIFKDCPKLTNLWISKMDNHSNSSCSRTENVAQFNCNSIFHPDFTFKNSKYLPISLFQLEIWTGHVIPEELVDLTLRFRDMVSLHYFRLTSATVFYISLECFQNIISIPDSWIQAHFYNGLLADNFCPQRLLLEAKGHSQSEGTNSERSWEVKISDNGCEFLCRESKTYF